MKNFYLLLIAFTASFTGFSQTTLYSENFTGQNGVGYVYPTGTTGLGTVSWTIDLNGSEPDFFNVTNEQFISEYTFPDGTLPRWISPSINITGYTNVSLSLAAFTSGNMENADTFRVEYRLNGTGVWTTAAVNGYQTNDFNLTISQTGLSGTSLQIRVTNTNDSGERHTFDNVLVSGTSCVNTLPFSESFNGTTFPPACWTSYRGANGAGTGFDWSRVTTNTRTGAGAAFVRYENVTGTNTNPAEDWLVTPAIDLASTTNSTLKFWCRDNPYTDNSNYTVRISTSSQTDRNSFTTLASYTEFGGTYLEQIVNLSVYDGQTVYIAFVMINDDGDNWFIDDVSVTGIINYTYDNAWIPSSPIGVSTTANNIVIANGNAVFTGNTQSNTIIVNPTGSVTVNTGANLASANGMTLQSNSTQYSSLILDGTVTGTVNYTRHVNGQTGVGVGTGANDLVSAPVTGQSFSSLVTANPNLRSDPNNADRKLFGPFNKSTGTYDLWINTVGQQANNTLGAGVGYRTASTDNGGFTFTGTPNKGIITNNIVNSGPQFAAYNLIGNPYPSYLNVYDFLRYDVDPAAVVVTNMDLMDTYGAVYGYDGDSAGTGSDGWITYNLTTPTTVNLAPGQGFLVTADAAQVAAYDMTFNPSMRRIDATDDFIPGRTANDNVHLKLQANIGNSVYKTDLFFIEGTTSGMDFGYDAAVFGANASAKSIYSQLVANNTGVDLSIQSLAYDALGTDIVVPIGINVAQGQQVTVTIAESDLPSNIDVYLEDTVTGTFTLLNTGDYVFTSNTTLNDTGRFFLRFADQTLSTPDATLNQLQIFTTVSPRALVVKGLLADTTSVQIYDVQGRLVQSSQLEASTNTNQVDVANLSSGVYVVKLNNTTQQKTQKVILK